MIRKAFVVVIFLGVGFGFKGIAPQSACAANFFETIGISTAVGTVLGASTLPFYENPGSHTSNIATGAAIGALVGFGVWVYELIWGSDPEDRVAKKVGTSAPFESGSRFQIGRVKKTRSGSWTSQFNARTYVGGVLGLKAEHRSESTVVLAEHTPSVWVPLVSLNW